MALDPVPWFIGGGAEHSPDVARLLAFAATGGRGGVVGRTDMRVTQLPAANGNFRVAAGACVIPNLYENVPQQSYIARAPSVTDVPITPTGSTGGRSDMVVIRIDDPQFGGQVPADVKVGPYVRIAVISGVSPTATTLPPTVNYPAIPLARIDLPANTATVTQALIKDLREVAQPRSERVVKIMQPTANSDVTTTSTADWTPGATTSVAVPSWASECSMIVRVDGAVSTSGSITGGFTAMLGTRGLAATMFTIPATNSRGSLAVAETFAVDSAMRGTTQTLKLRANRSGAGALRSDAYTTVVYELVFTEKASAD